MMKGKVAPSRRTFGSRSDIGLTMNLYEINMARIAKKLLSKPRFDFDIQKSLIAAVFDCEPGQFGFVEEEYMHNLSKRKSQYYKDLAYLLDDLNATGPEHEDYEYDENGEIQGRVIINRNDPARIAKLDIILRDIKADIESWSMSRDPGSTSILFQASGGLSLNRLAFYVAANSPYRDRLFELVPNLEKLSYGAYPKTETATCERLLK